MTLTLLLLQLFPVFLKNIPGISAKIQQIVADVAATTAAIIGSGVLTQPNVNTILAAWSGIIAALEHDPTLPADSLKQVAQLRKIVTAVLTEDAKLAVSVDWSLLQPITPVP